MKSRRTISASSVELTDDTVCADALGSHERRFRETTILGSRIEFRHSNLQRYDYPQSQGSSNLLTCSLDLESATRKKLIQNIYYSTENERSAHYCTHSVFSKTSEHLQIARWLLGFDQPDSFTANANGTAPDVPRGETTPTLQAS